MPYIDEITEPLIHTLEHTGGLPVEQLAGHAANIDFWIGEVKHVFGVIDGYEKRFQSLTQGVKEYANRQYLKGTPVYHGYPTALPLKRGIDDQQLKELRRRLADVAYRMLARCYNNDLITDVALDASAHLLDYDVRELKRKKSHTST